MTLQIFPFLTVCTVQFQEKRLFMQNEAFGFKVFCLSYED